VSTIGIKIANGSYYPIIDTAAVGKKRLVLTTVKDNQENVQVDIFRGDNGSLENADYIGSLVLENIGSAGKGEPELELILGIDESENLTASISDALSGEKQSLSLSLDALSEGGDFDLPDFDLDASIEPTSQVTSMDEEPFAEEDILEAADAPSEEDFELGEELGDTDEFEAAEPAEAAQLSEPEPEAAEFDGLDEFQTDELEEEGESDFDLDEEFEGVEGTPAPGVFAEEDESGLEEPPPPVAEQRRANPGLLVIFVVLGLIIIGLLAFLIYRSFQGEESPGLFARIGATRTEEVGGPEPGMEADAGGSAEETAPAETGNGGESAAGDGAPGGQASAAAETEETASDAGDSAVLTENTMGGVWYWIRWGDTLWDLSYSFYRTPWLFGKIAGANDISNPDLIYADTRLFIPEL
jgi:hypothetical protein